MRVIILKVSWESSAQSVARPDQQNECCSKLWQNLIFHSANKKKLAPTQRPRRAMKDKSKRKQMTMKVAIQQYLLFLAVQNSSIGDLVTQSLTELLLLHTNSDPRDLWPLRHLFRVMRKHNLTNIYDNFDNFWQLWHFLHIFWQFANIGQFWLILIILTFLTIWAKTNTKTSTKTILETCDIWDTDYNSDNWYPEFMTFFVTWHLRETLDSIRNSCDVLFKGPAHNIWSSFLRTIITWKECRFSPPQSLRWGEAEKNIMLISFIDLEGGVGFKIAFTLKRRS